MGLKKDLKKQSEKHFLAAGENEKCLTCVVASVKWIFKSTVVLIQFESQTVNRLILPTDVMAHSSA